MNVSAFTLEYPAISKRLETDVVVQYGSSEVSAKALWDTGATSTCISKDIVDSLNLIALGRQNILTPSGLSIANTYMVDIVLPNHVTVTGVKVCDSEIGSQGLGVLIGMDIINLGDFAVSNYNDRTTFSFRIPSQIKTDYVVKAKFQDALGAPHGKGKRKRK